MLILLGLTYWAFMAVSMGVLSNLLLSLSWHHGVLIIGFFVLAQMTKFLAEAVFIRKQAEVFKILQDKGLLETKQENDKCDSQNSLR